MRRIDSSMWLGAILLIGMAVTANGFTLSPSATSRGRGDGGLFMSSIDNDGQSPAQKKQEQRMEMASIKGAHEIAKLDIQERTKRAMLAEAVEDRIFELVDDLDQLVAKNGGLEELSEEVKEEAVEMAKQTKALQIQYDDLVSGKPSHLLDLSID